MEQKPLSKVQFQGHESLALPLKQGHGIPFTVEEWPVNAFLNVLQQSKPELNRVFYVQQIGIFGSYAKNEQKKNSDLDILVFLSKNGETFDNYMKLKFFLSKILKKKKIDLVIENSIREPLKPLILSSVLYA